MAIKAYAEIFRLPVDVSRSFAAVADVLSAQVPNLPSGAALEFDFVFSDGPLADGTLLDLSIYDTIEFRIQDRNSPHASNTYIAASIIADDFQTCTTAAWQAGTAQQVQVVIPSAENILLPNNGESNYWLCVYGTLTAAAAATAAPPRVAGDAVPLCSFQLRTQDSGIPAVNPQAVLPLRIGAKMPFVCSDGQTRDVTLQATPNGRWALNIGAAYNGPGQALYSLACADALYRDVSLVLLDGVWTINIDQQGHA
ncbi:MAG: hypothetical protein KGL39_50960 [Patescibacteria group bacterium]|nr:hypothetical protein [Patescibacteria group bacterium]